MKCHLCQERRGEIDICDSKGKGYLICEECDDKMEWTRCILQQVKNEGKNGRKRN